MLRKKKKNQTVEAQLKRFQRKTRTSTATVLYTIPAILAKNPAAYCPFPEATFGSNGLTSLVEEIWQLGVLWYGFWVLCKSTVCF